MQTVHFYTFFKLFVNYNTFLCYNEYDNEQYIKKHKEVYSMKRLSHETNKMIVGLYASGKSVIEIAEELEISEGVIYKKLRKYKNILEKKKKEKDEEIADIIDQVQGPLPNEIADKIFKIVNNQENLELEFLERGIDPLNRILGTLLDKVIKIKELEQNKQIAEERDIQNDNFFEAMQEAIGKISKTMDLNNLIDENSKIDEDDDFKVN